MRPSSRVRDKGYLSANVYPHKLLSSDEGVCRLRTKGSAAPALITADLANVCRSRPASNVNRRPSAICFVAPSPLTSDRGALLRRARLRRVDRRCDWHEMETMAKLGRGLAHTIVRKIMGLDPKLGRYLFELPAKLKRRCG